ncbi:universal stress protein [Deinococcus aerolatus]|uniref:Universal stress protein n=1 Tax=Deinococcus aerolatus TaxID=522487 RepID=A0ABQ2GEQ0_9DEIO|nr:universal stress protein [Deinococcus aerolatus]GGL90654.1 universal stress protein [Deinococcus aerolatus]
MTGSRGREGEDAVFNQVLIGIDFSVCSRQALHTARQHFPEARRRLMYVAAAGPTAPTALDLLTVDNSEPSDTERGRVRLEVLCEAGETSCCVAGHPATALLDEARRWGADLIVLGTHGRRGLSHLFFGSVAQGVVRAAPMPVLTVRAVEETR